MVHILIVKIAHFKPDERRNTLITLFDENPLLWGSPCSQLSGKNYKNLLHF